MDRTLHTPWSMDGAACRTLGALARGHVWGVVVVVVGEECAGQERPHLDELLLQAILGGQTNVATTLLELGANAQHVDEQGHDAVMWAATLTDQPELGMDTLLESGAPLGARNHEGMTAHSSTTGHSGAARGRLACSIGSTTEPRGTHQAGRLLTDNGGQATADVIRP